MKPQHKIFADEIIKGADHTVAYMKAYPKAKVTSARVKGYGLLQNVTIRDYIKQKSEKIEAKAEKKAVEALKNKIVEETLTAERKKEILRQIAEGKLLVKRYEPFYNEDAQKWETKPIEVLEPNHDQRIKAIAAHNLMTGENAPPKAPVDENGETVTPKAVIVFNGAEIKI